MQKGQCYSKKTSDLSKYEAVWVAKRHNPEDLRSLAPVVLPKLHVDHSKRPFVEEQWKPAIPPPPVSYFRQSKLPSLSHCPKPKETCQLPAKKILPAIANMSQTCDYSQYVNWAVDPTLHQHRKCQERTSEWSTLRQMLPLPGNVRKVYQPNWGIDPSMPQIFDGKPPPRVPTVRSAMSKFEDHKRYTTNTKSFREGLLSALRNEFLG